VQSTPPDRQNAVPPTRYRTIVADPPWDLQRLESPGSAGFGTQRGTLRSVRLPYPTMSVAELCGIPLRDYAESDAHLYIWTVNRYVEETYAIARAWGFKPATLLTWTKAPMGLGPGGAFSQTSEHILFCRRGRDVRTARTDSTWWQWKRGPHSAKPDAFLDLVEQVSPGPYLEIFARRARFGWDYAGDGSLGTVDIPGLRAPGQEQAA
jgi:N6-adenosine-specific RNA methylase IME4